MSLQEAIYKAMDYEPEVPDYITYEEFNRKLGETYCLVNNTVYYIKRVTGNELECVDLDLQENISLTTVQSIEVLKPKPGLYGDRNSLFFLKKLPERQWKKSFCLDNHSVEVLDIYSKKPIDLKTLLENKYTYKKETIIYKNLVFFYNIAVGILKPHNATIVVFNSNFIDEINELWNQQYTIILDTNALEELPEKSL